MRHLVVFADIASVDVCALEGPNTLRVCWKCALLSNICATLGVSNTRDEEIFRHHGLGLWYMI